MKRMISFLLAFCLVLSVSSAALAASSRPSITEQPVTTTVRKNGDVAFTVKAKNAGGASITWYFTNPSTGEVTTGKQLSKYVPGLKVANPNSLSIKLKNVPVSMHGWMLYCHIGPKSGGVSSDTVMLLIEGMDVPDTLTALNGGSSSSETETGASAGSDGSVTAARPTPTPVPEKIVISGNSRFELLAVDSKGEPVGKPQDELTFADGSASFYVRLPESTEGTIQYVTINSLRITPDGDVRGIGIRGWNTSASVRVKVNKPGSGEEDTSGGLVLPEEEETPVDPSSLVTVTCVNCRFTGYHSSFAESGQVPVGTTITVIASGGMITKGYFINGAKKAVHKKEASFQLLIEGDTTITMEKQK